MEVTNGTDRTLQLILQEQAAMREQIKTIFNTMTEQKKLTESVHTLALSVRDVINEQKTQSKEINNLASCITLVRADVDGIKEKPARRWESVVSILITAVVTAAATYILTQAGLK